MNNTLHKIYKPKKKEKSTENFKWKEKKMGKEYEWKKSKKIWVKIKNSLNEKKFKIDEKVIITEKYHDKKIINQNPGTSRKFQIKWKQKKIDTYKKTNRNKKFGKKGSTKKW